MARLRLILWALVAVAALVGGYLYLTTPQQVGQIETMRADPDAQVQFGGDFTLAGADGEPFSSSELAGRPHAIFFGFTNCPDICPTTLSDLVRLRRDIGGEDAFDIVFVTVDPARDGPEEVGRYTELFGSPIIGLTGSEAQIEQVMEQYGVARIMGEGENYKVDHTATVFLMDRQGEFVATISPEESRDVTRTKLERIAA